MPIDPKRLIEARAKRNWTQQDLASASGLNKKSISRIERSEVDPLPATIYKLADALNCSPSYLTGDTDSIHVNALYSVSDNKVSFSGKDGKHDTFTIDDSIKEILKKISAETGEEPAEILDKAIKKSLSKILADALMSHHRHNDIDEFGSDVVEQMNYLKEQIEELSKKINQ